MKRYGHFLITLGIAIGLVFVGSLPVQAAVMGTAFTYQGQLTSSGTPVNGACDFQLILYDALVGGSQIGPIVTKTGVTVTNGLFTTSLDFGSGAFSGTARWLEIAAKCGAEPSYTTLSPRQELTPTPYAIHAANADLLDGQHASAFATASHTHAGEHITSGTVADARIASTIARDSEIMSTVLANDGPGSTLNADYLDGWHASAFATTSHTHAGEHITSGTVADARIASTIARDSEIMSTVLANDGPGSTLNADVLDGLNSSAFQRDIVLAYSTTGSTTSFTNTCANYSGGSVTISATGAGSVIVEANVWVRLTHTNGTQDTLILGIGTDATDCGTSFNQVWWDIPSAYPSSTSQNMTFTVRRRFAVSSSGSYTYYLNGYMDSGYAASTDHFWYAEMIAIFYPD